MSYLDNLETVRKKDLLLPDESKEYLHDVYNVCDKYITKHHEYTLWDYYLKYIDDNIGEIATMLEIQTSEFESTLGMHSISYYPKDEFGEPDRSTWEPRRNNWNQ